MKGVRVLLRAFCNERTVHYRGYTEKAARRKIEDGVWLEGKVWCKAPDGHVMIIMDGYEAWAAGERVAA